MATGAAAKLGIGPETTYGTAIAPTIGIPADWNVKPNRATLRYEGAGVGNATQVGDPGRNSVAGDFSNTPITPNLAAHLLRAFCGPRFAFLAGTPNTHTFRPALTPSTGTNARPGYTIHSERSATKIHRFAGAQCDKLTFECLADGRLTVQSSWMSKSYAAAVTATPAIDTLTPFRYRHAAHKIADAPAAPAAFAFFKDIKIEMMNGIVGNICQDGTDDYSSFHLGLVGVKMSGKICYQDSVLANKWQASTLQSVDVDYNNTINTPATRIRFLMPNFRLDEVDDFSVSGPGLLEQTFTGTAEFNAGISNMVSIELGNALADLFN
jgi:hypothetical protein